MAKKELADLAKRVRKNVTNAVEAATKHYHDLVDALEAAQKVNVAWRSSGGSGNIVNEREFISVLQESEHSITELTSAYDPLTKKIEELVSECNDIEDLLYLVDELEALVPLVEKSNFKAAAYGVDFTAWSRQMRLIARKWKDKLYSDKKLREAVLLNTITVEEKELKKARGMLERNQEALESCYADIEELLLHYSDEAADLVGQATQELNVLFGELEKVQEELAAITLEQLDAVEAVATASLFEKGKMRKRQEEIWQKHETKKAELDALECKVGEFVEKVLAVKLKNLDERLDESLDRVQELKNTIAGNQNEVQSHVDIIERAKGELNGK